MDDVVLSSGPLGVEEAQTFGAGLASLLNRLHTTGAVHGDIRPATVFLTPKGPRLGDGDPFRRAAIVNDSLYFVAPELLENPGEVSSATDVFAFGAVLAFAASGASPMGSRSATDPGQSPERPDLSAVPKELRGIIERCVDANPAARPTAVALSILLAAGLTEVPAAQVPAVPALPTDADDRQGGAESRTDAVPGPETAPAKPFRAYFIGALALTAAVAVLIAMSVTGDSPRGTVRSAPGTVTETTEVSVLPTLGSDSAVPGAGVTTAAIIIASPSAALSSQPPAIPVSPTAPASSSKTSQPPRSPRTTPSTSAARVGVLDDRGAAPASPGAPRLVSGYVMTVDVRWAAASGATSYEVSYTGSVSGTVTVTTTGTSTTLKGLFPSEQVCAKVRSVNRNGASAWVSGAGCVMVI